MNGKILDSVGFTKVDGAIRKLNIRERLLQIKMSKVNGELNHPVHGKIVVDYSKLDYLIKYTDHELYRFKLSMFTV